MSANFTGVTFAKQRITPSDDAIIRRAILPDGILTGCELSYSGSTLTMSAGQLMICGRQVRHSSAQNWAVVDATSGYARLLLTIDLTRTSTKEVFDQVLDTIEYASSEDGFPDLEQADINGSGTRYQVVACVVSLGSGGISGIVSQLGLVRSKIVTRPVVLPSANWQDNLQTIAVAGVTADAAKSDILASPDPSDENYSAYCESGVRLYAQLDGAVTFKCEDVPGIDLTVNVMVKV